MVIGSLDILKTFKKTFQSRFGMGQSCTHFFYKEISLHILIANFPPGFLRPLFIKIIPIFGLSQKRKNLGYIWQVQILK